MKILTLAGLHAEELVVKKSRFMACAASVDSVLGAMDFLDSCKDKDASHNCWAYKVGHERRFSDDGEPSGTAGKPIMSAIESSGLDNVVVSVVRYFGGIKLGAGGLIRAYGGAANQCLREAPKLEVSAMTPISIKVGFDFVGQVMMLVDPYPKIDSEFNEDGATVYINVPDEQIDALAAAVRDRTRGSAQINILQPTD